MKLTKETMKALFTPLTPLDPKQIIKQEMDNFPKLLYKTLVMINAAMAVGGFDKHEEYSRWARFVAWIYKQEAMEIPSVDDPNEISQVATALNMLGLVVSGDDERIEQNLSNLARMIKFGRKFYGDERYKKYVESYFVKRS